MTTIDVTITVGDIQKWLPQIAESKCNIARPFTCRVVEEHALITVAGDNCGTGAVVTVRLEHVPNVEFLPRVKR